jgi:hypothetical protein
MLKHRSLPRKGGKPPIELTSAKTASGAAYSIGILRQTARKRCRGYCQLGELGLPIIQIDLVPVRIVTWHRRPTRRDVPCYAHARKDV